ncbi:hypothetical protein [Streptomyces sp. Tu 3180]|uniref:hypothetical protein n=1 Tax=Streptomyces sp. Tu 3180 TaxID=2682611 RepID=UPI00135BB17D|nr:hypothetical protein [Streptomyces sp. Tu 3180]KAF3465374.1 hypothetical protein GL259_14185 [Streptomyces sp. Tu 3180]
MDLEKSAPAVRGDASRGEGCLAVAIRVPVRIVALVLVVPVRMAWDALVVAGRFLGDAVFRPLGRASLWVVRAVFVWPFAGLWRYVLVPLGKVLAWLGKALVVLPAAVLYRHVLTPLGHALLWVYARVLTPAGHAVVRALRVGGAVLAALGAGAYAGLAWLTRYLVVVPSVRLYTWVLAPAGHAVAWCVKGLVRLVTMIVTGVGAGLYWITRILFVLPALAVWRWVLVPVGGVLAVVAREVGNALGHAWRVAGRVSLAVGRFLGALFRWVFVEPVRWVYRSVLTPVGYMVRDAVLRPVAEAVRGAGRAARQALAAARASVRRARADVRRVLLGEPAGSRPGKPAAPRPVDRREPTGRETRTLGSRTTSLTKD